MNKFILAGALALALGVYMGKRLPRGIRNNNPGNIRKSGDTWDGAIGDDGAFVVFESPKMGIRAMARVLKNYRDKHGINTIAGIIDRYAPDSENNTNAYIQSVSAKTGILEFTPLRQSDYAAVIEAMIFHENGQQPYRTALIAEGVQLGFA